MELVSMQRHETHNQHLSLQFQHYANLLRLQYRTLIWHCCIFSHVILLFLISEKTLISLISVSRNLSITAFPNDPVPPVISSTLSLNILSLLIISNFDYFSFLKSFTKSLMIASTSSLEKFLTLPL